MALLDDEGRQVLVQCMRQQIRVTGLELLTYCVMNDHLHVLVRVPETRDLPEEEIVARLEALYGEDDLRALTARTALAQQGRMPSNLRRLIENRAGDISHFMKETKQRFSRWLNQKIQRGGTAWAQQFKASLIEDRPEVMSLVAAYVDLNPVRAGVVSDPRDYPFCGYAAACAGDVTLQRGLMACLGAADWPSADAQYRKLMLIEPETPKDAASLKLGLRAVRNRVQKGEALKPGVILRFRLRRMIEGTAIGSEAFANEFFNLNRAKFGAKRTSGARPMAGLPLYDLSRARDF